MQHEVERERNMALWRGRGRGTVHSKVWLLSRLSGSDFDVSVFFGLTSRLTGPQELPSPCLIKTFQTSVTMAPPGFCSLLKKGQKSITRVTAAFLTPLTSQTESKLRTGRNFWSCTQTLTSSLACHLPESRQPGWGVLFFFFFFGLRGAVEISEWKSDTFFHPSGSEERLETFLVAQ